MTSDAVSRRTVLIGTVATGLGLSACGGGTDEPSGAGGTTPAGTSAPPAGAGLTAKTADIPVGGGKIFEAEKVVVTQPAPGQFKAFTAVCTHQGCTVSEVTGDTIKCPCHGSQYNAADGSVKNGPATQPLAGKTVTVQGDTITVA